MELLKKLLKGSLHGENTHIDPLKGIEGLNDQKMLFKPSQTSHSAFDIIFHLVCWQDLIIKSLNGIEAPWSQLIGKDWPNDSIQQSSSWEEIKEKYINGLQKIESLIETIDLSKTIPSLANATNAKLILVIAQHNSYHIGQLATIRKLNGDWPPQDITDF